MKIIIIIIMVINNNNLIVLIIILFKNPQITMLGVQILVTKLTMYFESPNPWHPVVEAL